MTSRERLEKCWAFERPDRVPFIPAVYEQKAFLINDTPSRVARDADLFHRALLTEHETYEADALVIGMDVYNLEAEALGSTVTYYEGDDTSIPGIGTGQHALEFGDDLSGLKVPDPRTDGRMPINLEVARRVADLHATVPVRGAVSGPISLALSLLGPEDFFMGTLDDPAYCQRVLEFCADVILTFGQAYLDAGVGVIMFDSQASPDLFSSAMYEKMVLPHTQRVIAGLRDAGETVCPLIIGGDTTRLADAYVRTGSRQILCDFPADWKTYARICSDQRLAVRRNISPSDIQNGDPDELAATAHRYLSEARGMPGFILGTAVLPFGTPTRNVLAIRDAVRG